MDKASSSAMRVACSKAAAWLRAAGRGARVGGGTVDAPIQGTCVRIPWITLASSTILLTVACSAPSTEAPSGRAFASFAVAPPAGEPGPTQKMGLLGQGDEARRAPPSPCPTGMAEIPSSGRGERTYCIDKWEASLLEVSGGAEESPRSPFAPVDGKRVRAVSAPGIFPQGYVSAVEAEAACAASGKRLCRAAEWQKACRGPDKRAFGYGDRREPGRCNDKGRNPVMALYGARSRGWNWTMMNRPELNQLEGTLVRTGAREGCTNGYGVFDMVGNLHEWVADRGGTFYGGYYQDVSSVGHGSGCGYMTTAHEARYHDYSTGFRCCADASFAGR
jgi:formylglycine-generating enzyme